MARACINLLLCLTALIAAPVFAGTNSWSSIGPYGGTIEQLKFDPVQSKRMIAVSAGAVIVSADGGESWTEVYYQGKRLTALTVAAGASRLYAAVDFNVLVSTDGGKNWNISSTFNNSVVQLEVDALDGRLVYARLRTLAMLGSNQIVALMRSTDGGANWTRLPLALDGRSIADVVPDPKRSGIVYAGVFSDGFGGGSTYFKSVDAGDSFIDMQPGPSAGAFSSLAIDRVNPNVLYVTRLADGRQLVNLARSIDGGITWQQLATPLPGAYAGANGQVVLVTDPFAAGTVYHFTPIGFRIFRSVDYGSTWSESPVATPRSDFRIIGVADLAHPGRYWIAASNGLYVSDDGVNWREVTRGFASRSVNAMVVGESRVTVATLPLTFSTVDQKAWAPIASSAVPLDASNMARRVGLASPTIASPPWSARVYAVGRSDGSLTNPVLALTGDPVLYSSVDDGATWTTKSMSGDVPNVLVAVSDSSTASGPLIMAGLQVTFGCSRSGSCDVNGMVLTLSRDGGTTWQRSVLPSTATVGSVAIPPVGITAQVPVILVGTNAGILRSSDAGASFQLSTTTPPPGRLLADPHRGAALYAWSDRFYRSVDGGLTWLEGTLDSPLVATNGAISAIAFSESNANRMEIATATGRLLRSDDGGASFTTLTNGPAERNPLQGFTLFGRREPHIAYYASFMNSVFAYTIDRDRPVDVVEFHNTFLDHYFLTAGAEEALSIDRGAAGPGWTRTGFTFKASLPTGVAPPDAQPVCRFYGTPGRGPNSHFYTASPAECAAVKLDPGWTYEGIAFYLFGASNGQCARGQQAVYRAYNNGFVNNDSNHRYSTQLGLLQEMRLRGWIVEGVAFCGEADQ